MTFPPSCLVHRYRIEGIFQVVKLSWMLEIGIVHVKSLWFMP